MKPPRFRLHAARVDDPAGGPSQLTDSAYVVLVCSLYRTLLPTAIMAASFTAVGAIILRKAPDLLLLVLFAGGIAASLARLIVLLLHRATATDTSLDAIVAGKLERRFAFVYFAFAAAFGLFAARAFVVAPPMGQLLVVGLVFGYGAGVAAGISLRPWISVSSALIAILPSIAVCLFALGRSHIALGILTAIFLAGGIESMLRRYQETSALITAQGLLAKLPRRDGLTGLPDRLGLGERFAALGAKAEGNELVVVHRIELTGLRAINQSHSYPVGDAVIRAVSERLGRVMSSRDVFGRLAGAEFVIIQPHVIQVHQARLFAERIIEVLGLPFILDGRHVDVGAVIGFAFENHAIANLDTLLSHAQTATRRAIAEASRVSAFQERGWRSSGRDRG